MKNTLRPPANVRLQAPLLKWFKQLNVTDAETVDLNGRGASDKVLDALAAWPGLDKVRHLDLSGNRFTGDSLPAILEVVAPRLETLDLSNNPRLREQGFGRLADRPWPALRKLRLRMTKLRKGLAVLQKLDAPALEVLDAYDAGFGAAGAKALAASSILPQLKVLGFGNGDPGMSGFEALQRVLPSTQLVDLDLGRRHIDAALLESLLDGPIRHSLRALSLENDDPTTLAPLDDMQLTSLRVGGSTFHALPTLPQLKRLVTSYTGSQVAGPLPDALLDQLEVIRCAFPHESKACGLLALAKTSSSLRVMEISGGTPEGGAALAHARFIPYLEAMCIDRSQSRHIDPHFPEITSRAESLRTLGLGTGLDAVGTLRWCQHLDIERIVTTMGKITSTGLLASPTLQNAEVIYLNDDGSKIPTGVLDALGDKLRFSSYEPLDVLAGLDYAQS